ncbi:unnamed protein product [Closterium sp. Naga37s-1]|nr:unnamed protein product [Closterium sp. Naga37s-1]
MLPLFLLPKLTFLPPLQTPVPLLSSLLSSSSNIAFPAPLERECSICGVEIVDNARPIQSHPFTGNTAFLLGNEGTGLSPTELAVCDSFVYIPQHGPGTASLNVIVAASIVLHHFAVWAQYPEREREGAKFSVAARPLRRGPRNRCPEDPAELTARRQGRQEAADSDTWQDFEDGSLGLLEGEEGDGES